jgi:hypothetical protein
MELYWCKSISESIVAKLHNASENNLTRLNTGNTRQAALQSLSFIVIVINDMDSLIKI